MEVDEIPKELRLDGQHGDDESITQVEQDQPNKTTNQPQSLLIEPSDDLDDLDRAHPSPLAEVEVKEDGKDLDRVEGGNEGDGDDQGRSVRPLSVELGRPTTDLVPGQMEGYEVVIDSMREPEVDPDEEGQEEEVTPEPIDQDQVGRLVGFEEVDDDQSVDLKVGGEDEGGREGGVVERGDSVVVAPPHGMDVELPSSGGVGNTEAGDEGEAGLDLPMDLDSTTREERESSESRGRREIEEKERTEEEEKVDMDRLLNSIEVTKRATFLRQRLSSVGRRPPGETLGPSFPSASTSTSSPSRSRPGPMEGLSNPFSSPPSSPPPRTPGGRIKKDIIPPAAGAWRQPVGLDSPVMPLHSPSYRLHPASAGGSASRPLPRTPMTPVKKRKLDYMDSPFRSPGDLMALTLESPGKNKRGEEAVALDVDMDGRDEVKRRGKVWVGGSPAMVKVGPGQHGRTTSFSAAKVLFSNSNDPSMVRIGRRASMGTGPRLGFALPRKDRGMVDPVTVEVGEQERTAPRRAMGIEGYLADRYSDVLGRSKYPPPLPSTTVTPATLVKPKPMFELGHRRRISGSSTGKPASAIRGGEKYVSFLGGKKPRSSSHSLATGQRPSGLNPSTGGGPGEMAEAANVLTGMLGGSPLRRSTASPSRPPKSNKMYARDGEELGFRIPSSRPSGGGGRPRSESTERRMEMLPPVISGQVTPPRQISKLPHLRHTDGKPVGVGDTGDEDQRAAAEMMIFLAQSPGSTASGSREKRSFVQGAGVGRVLFEQRGEGETSRDTSVLSDV